MKKDRKNLLLPAVALVVVCLAVVTFSGRNKTTGTSSNNASSRVQTQNRETSQEIEQAAVQETAQAEDEETAQADAQESGNVTVIAEGEALKIPVSEVTTDASFFPVEVDGTQMEVIAVKGSDGTIRTAFNTCQICYSSGRGYYVQQGDVLVCQNCGSRFTVDQVEIENGGCNPWPIFEEDKTITDEYVEIAYDFLKESKEIFSNWKNAY